jgi:hypothetical protein
MHHPAYVLSHSFVPIFVFFLSHVVIGLPNRYLFHPEYFFPSRRPFLLMLTLVIGIGWPVLKWSPGSHSIDHIGSLHWPYSFRKSLISSKPGISGARFMSPFIYSRLCAITLKLSPRLTTRSVCNIYFMRLDQDWPLTCTHEAKCGNLRTKRNYATQRRSHWNAWGGVCMIAHTVPRRDH